MPQLAPLIAAGGGALAGFATFLQSGTILAGLVNAGLQAAGSVLLGMVMGSQTPSQSVQIETQFEAAPPRSVILGTVGTSGRHVFRNFYAKGNRGVADAVQLCDWRVSSVKRIRRDGEWVTPILDGEGWYEYGNSRIRAHLFPGLPNQVASPFLISSSAPRWGSDYRGDGIAYVELRNRLDVQALPRPWDAFFEVEGWPLYDWRKDSSVGGSGSDRWNNPATWSGRRDNPVLQMYALSRGFWLNGQLLVGKGSAPARLPLDKWTAAANIADELVEGGYRYRSNLIARKGKGYTHAQNMLPLLAACAASWNDDASGEYPLMGVNQAVVATITDDDLATEDDFRFSRYRPRSELVNTVSGQYSDPENFYEPGDYAVRIDEAALAADGEPLESQIDFTAVTDPKCVDRLADIALRASRYQANAEIWVRPKFIRVKPGDWIRWNSARYGNRIFQVLRKRLGPIGPSSCRNVFLQLQEVGEGVFDPTEFVTTSPDRVEQGAPDYQTELDNLQLFASYLEGENGIRRPAFTMSWDALEDESVVEVEVQYWPTAQPEAVMTKTGFTVDRKLIIDNGIVSDTDYTFIYRLIADPPRPTVWTAPISRRSLTAIGLGILVTLDDAGADLKGVLAAQGAYLDETRRRVSQLAAAAFEVAGKSVESQSVIRRNQGSLAAAVREMSAEVKDNGDAIAEISDFVQAIVGDKEAGVLWKMAAQAGSGDVTSQLAMMAYAKLAGIPVDPAIEAGLIIRAGFRGGNPAEPFADIMLKALQTFIVDGNGVVQALFNDDGTYLRNALISELTADNITADKIDAALILQNGTVIEDLISVDTFSRFEPLEYEFTYTGRAFDDGGWSHKGTLIVDIPTNKPYIEFIDLTAIASRTSTNVTTDAYIIIKKNGNNTNVAAGELFGEIRSQNSQGTRSDTRNVMRRSPTGSTTVRYDIWTWNSVVAPPGETGTVTVKSNSGIWVFR